MQTTTLINALKSLSDFSGRVVLATDLTAAVDAIKPFNQFPCCVLFGLAESASENQMGIGGGPRHSVLVNLKLLIVHRDVTDAVGAAALSRLNTVRKNVQTAVLGLVPDTNYRPLEYKGGQLAWAQAGMVMWLDEYRSEYLLSVTH